MVFNTNIFYVYSNPILCTQMQMNSCSHHLIANIFFVYSKYILLAANYHFSFGYFFFLNISAN